MKKTGYLPWILGVEAVGILSGILSRESMQRYSGILEKPEFSPPAPVFPTVWTILYLLMGIGTARVAGECPGQIRNRALNIFVIQLVVNFFWSLIFFNARAYGFAFVWLMVLWILIIIMTVTFYRVDRFAALLQIPYLIWGIFAAYLNYEIWQLNR